MNDKWADQRSATHEIVDQQDSIVATADRPKDYCQQINSIFNQTICSHCMKTYTIYMLYADDCEEAQQ